MSRLADAVAFLRGRDSEMQDLLRHLVETNSHGENKAGVDACGEALREALAPTGMTLRRHRRERLGDHLVFETAATAGSRVALLLGHLDTVFKPGTFEGFRVDGGRAYGPGVLDMKGGLVVATSALRTLAQAGVLASVPVRFVVVTDEEAGSVDARDVIASELSGVVCALCFEPGREGDAIVTRRKGTGYARVMARGKAAHAGNAHRDGANAIWALARFVDGAQSLTDYGRGVTVNVGQISGGESPNSVPEHATCVVDLRFVATADGDGLEADLARVATEAEVPGTRLEVARGSRRPPMARTEASAALAAEYVLRQREAGLGGGEAGLAGGGSDASFASAAGVPSIDGLGPRGSSVHTRDEVVELASMVPKAEALVRFLWGRYLS